MASTFEFYSLGTLVEDVVKDDPYVKVNPIEVLPTTQGDASKREGTSGSFKNTTGGVDNFSANKSGAITAKYIPFGAPNGGVPMLHAGEMVLLCRYGGGDHFMWIPCSNSIKDRTTEYFLLMASAKPGRGSTAGSGDTYYVKGDSGDKYLRLHTSKANGELAAYDIELNGKDGFLTITDDKDNDIVLKSVPGELDININNKINVKTIETIIDTINLFNVTTKNAFINGSVKVGIKSNGSVSMVGKDSVYCESKDIDVKGHDKIHLGTNDFRIDCKSFEVDNGENELIDVLCDLLDALLAEVHIDSIGGNTQLDGSSKSDYRNIKSRLESFKK